MSQADNTTNALSNMAVPSTGRIEPVIPSNLASQTPSPRSIDSYSTSIDCWTNQIEDVIESGENTESQLAIESTLPIEPTQPPNIESSNSAEDQQSKIDWAHDPSVMDGDKIAENMRTAIQSAGAKASIYIVSVTGLEFDIEGTAITCVEENGNELSLTKKEAGRLAVDSVISESTIASDSEFEELGLSGVADEIADRLSARSPNAQLTSQSIQCKSIDSHIVFIAISTTAQSSKDAAMLAVTLARQSFVATSQIETIKLRSIGAKTIARRVFVSRLAGAKLLWTAAAAVILALFFPAPYRPTRECVFEPATRFYVTAPTDGRLTDSLVRPGDKVNTGQLLATLDKDQLQRDLAIAESEQAGAKKRADVARAKRETGEFRIAMLESEQAALKVASIKRHIAQSEIKSPTAGFVVRGDWQGSDGMPLKSGDTIFEVSPLEKFVAEIELLPEDLANIKVGDEVHFTSEATSTRRLDGKISRIDSTAQVVNDKCVFIAEVTVNDPDAQLRPGLKAQAVVAAGKKPIGWQLFDRPYRGIVNLWVW